jgi:hypothetical protein
MAIFDLWNIPSDVIQNLVKLIREGDLDIDGIAKYCALEDLKCVHKFIAKLLKQRQLQLEEKKGGGES